MKYLFTFSIIIFTSCLINAQEKLFPVIKGYGAVEVVNFKVELPDPNQEYKLISELYARQEDKEALNGYLDYAARIVNAHTASGVPQKNIRMAIVIFSGATSTVLTNEAYKERFGVDNPNIDLLDKLVAAGVEVIVCGQSMVKQDIQPAQVHSGVQKAFSRITATSSLLNLGYSVL